ncbi:hypothetical protein H8958_017541 [Nasalis larvatus]
MTLWLATCSCGWGFPETLSSADVLPTCSYRRFAYKSFFHPKKEGKAKKPEKEASNSSRETEPPPKAALKEWNGVVSDSDSPVKRPGRKAARVLGSEGEEEDEALSPAKGQKPAPDCSQVSPPRPATSPENSASLSDTSPMDGSPSGIPKRRTEVETPEESLTEAEVATEKEGEDRDQPTTPPKPLKTSEAGTPTESISEPEVATRQELQEEEEQTKPPRSAPKTLSSFFTPRKPAIKKEVKEEEPGAPGKEGAAEGVPYLAVARTFEKIEEVSAR